MHPTVMGSHAAQSCSRTVGRAENSAPPRSPPGGAARAARWRVREAPARAPDCSAKATSRWGSAASSLSPSLADHAHGDVALVKGVPSRKETFFMGDLPVEPRVSGLADAARHEHDDVRLLSGSTGSGAQALSMPATRSGIVLVHLAAEGVDAKRVPSKTLLIVKPSNEPRLHSTMGAIAAAPPRLDGEADGRAVLAVDDDVTKEDAADLDAPPGRRTRGRWPRLSQPGSPHRPPHKCLNLHRRPS